MGKRTRILDAALGLFLRYGVKRTSMDDVAREAGIAKGTLYLYYDTKEDVFAAVAGRICKGILDQARAALASPAPLTERIVGLLDAKVGATHRLLAQSPLTAELIESKKAFAVSTFAAFDRQIKDILSAGLRDGGIAQEGAAEMFLAAAYGALKTGDTAEEPYRLRLTALVDTLIAGLRSGPKRARR